MILKMLLSIKAFFLSANFLEQKNQTAFYTFFFLTASIFNRTYILCDNIYINSLYLNIGISIDVIPEVAPKLSTVHDATALANNPHSFKEKPLIRPY